jgi:hypothetical protein
VSQALGQSASDSPASESADPKEKSPETDSGSNEKLAKEQQRIAEQYAHLEEVLLRMAELSPSTDPRRAALLKKAVAQSKEQSIAIRMNELVELMDKGKLSNALENQTNVDRDLQSLLELLLSENRSQHIESEKARIREYLKRLGRIIKQEKDVQGRTLGGSDTKPLAEEQLQLADKTGDLLKDVQKNEDGKGEKKDADLKTPQSRPPEHELAPNEPSPNEPAPNKPAPNESEPKGEPTPGDNEGENAPSDGSKPTPNAPEGKPSPSSPQGEKPEDSQSGDAESQKQEPQSHAQKRLETAQQRMKEAEAKLKEAQREAAGQKQEEAILEMEQAKAQLEETLRQLREEEIERTLAMLEARFRRMLAMQQEVYDGTVRLDKVPEPDRTHNHEIEASRLSGKESQIVVEVDKALLVLHEDGTAAAIPEASEQIREDMQQVVRRLAQAKVGKVTQTIEEDILASLKEMIDALKKAQKDQEAKKKNKSRQQQGGSQQNPPLVDMLAELKMIRALQMRVNTRTEQYSRRIEGEQAENAEVIEALKQLGERQQRIHRVMHDLQMEKGR